MHSKLPLIIAPLLAILVVLGFAPPATGIATSTTGLPVTTGGTTGATGGGPTSSGSKIYIVDISEDKSASTYGYFTVGGTSSWQTLTGRHVVGIQYHVDSWTYTGSWDAHVTSHTHGESLYVEAGTEMGVLNGDTIGSDTTDTSVSVRGFDSTSSTGHDVRIQTSDTGAISSGRVLTYWIKVVDTITYDNAPPSTTTVWNKYDMELIKLSVHDASIDTRRAYGQPNTGGEIQLDANAPLRTLNFGPWFWKGGLFIGNMPAGGKDASGTARIQFYPQGGSTYESSYLFASLSLFDRGKPSHDSISGDVDTGVYFPGASDSHLSTGENDVTWDTKWNITAGAVDGSSTDYTLHPLFHRTLSDGNTDNYVTFPLTHKVTGAKPATALTGVCLAIVSETGAASSSIWHYFASEEFQDAGASFPLNDNAPRVWLIQPYDP